MFGFFKKKKKKDAAPKHELIFENRNEALAFFKEKIEVHKKEVARWQDIRNQAIWDGGTYYNRLSSTSVKQAERYLSEAKAKLEEAETKYEYHHDILFCAKYDSESSLRGPRGPVLKAHDEFDEGLKEAIKTITNKEV